MLFFVRFILMDCYLICWYFVPELGKFDRDGAGAEKLDFLLLFRRNQIPGPVPSCRGHLKNDDGNKFGA